MVGTVSGHLPPRLRLGLGYGGICPAEADVWWQNVRTGDVKVSVAETVVCVRGTTRMEDDRS